MSSEFLTQPIGMGVERYKSCVSNSYMNDGEEINQRTDRYNYSETAMEVDSGRQLVDNHRVYDDRQVHDVYNEDKDMPIVKALSRADLEERILGMLEKETECMPRPDYIEAVQREKDHVIWRGKVSSWLLEFEEEFGFSQDTIAVAVNYMDRYLCNVVVGRSILQLLAMASLLIATKLHEAEPMPMGELRDLADGIYSDQDIKLMELEVLRVIEWKLNPVTAQAVMSHLVQYIDEPKQRVLIFEDAVTFLDVVLPEYEFLCFAPSVQATAAVLCAFHLANLCSDSWVANTAIFGLMGNPQVQECKAKMLENFYSLCPDARLAANPTVDVVDRFAMSPIEKSKSKLKGYDSEPSERSSPDLLSEFMHDDDDPCTSTSVRNLEWSATYDESKLIYHSGRNCTLPTHDLTVQEPPVVFDDNSDIYAYPRGIVAAKSQVTCNVKPVAVYSRDLQASSVSQIGGNSIKSTFC